VDDGFSATDDCGKRAGVKSLFSSDIFFQNKKINFSFNVFRYSLDFKFYSQNASFFKLSPMALDKPIAYPTLNLVSFLAFLNINLINSLY